MDQGRSSGLILVVARRTVEPCCRPLIWGSFRVILWDFGNRETNSPDKRSPPPARTGPPLVRLGGCPLGVPFAPPPSPRALPPSRVPPGSRRHGLRSRGRTAGALPPPAPPAPRATARSFARALARLAAHRADKPSPSSPRRSRRVAPRSALGSGETRPGSSAHRSRDMATLANANGLNPNQVRARPRPRRAIARRRRARARARAPRHQPILSTFEPFRVAFRDDRAAPLLSRDRTHARLFTPPPRPTPPRSSRSPRW